MHASPQQGIINKKPCKVYATTVHVVFIDEEAKNVLSPKFKSFTDITIDTIEITLSFPNPLNFNEYADKRMDSLGRPTAGGGIIAACLYLVV